MKAKKYHTLMIILVIISSSIAYCVLVFNVHTLYGITSTTYVKIIISSIYAPGIGIVITRLISKKTLAVIFSLLYNLCYFIIILPFLIYFKYFSALPHINMLRQIYLIPAVIDQILLQLFTKEIVLVLILAVLTIAGTINLALNEANYRHN